MAASSDRLRPRSLVCWPVCARLCVGKVFENGFEHLAARGYDPLDSVAPDPRSIAADPLGPVTLDLLGSVAPDGWLPLDALAGTDSMAGQLQLRGKLPKTMI